MKDNKKEKEDDVTVAQLYQNSGTHCDGWSQRGDTDRPGSLQTTIRFLAEIKAYQGRGAEGHSYLYSRERWEGMAFYTVETRRRKLHVREFGDWNGYVFCFLFLLRSFLEVGGRSLGGLALDGME